ncbi:MAG: ketoacyl-ACP synthase III [Acidobacteria bacterium]|nr:ketoacyl-ACP synthase III [Acidobacteriota bacterium]
MGVRFAGWGVGLGERVVTNDDLSQTLDTSDEWISERTGIRSRRIGGSASSLGIVAGRNALNDAGLRGDDIDHLVLSTTTGDRVIPGTAPIIASELGIRGGAVDLNAACSGFMYGLAVARGLIATGAGRVLLVGAENLSRWTDWEDRSTAVLFGDGAGAVVLEADSTDAVRSLNLGADGSLADLIYADHGGFIHMDGREVFRRAVRIVVESAERALHDAHVTMDDVSLVLAHQANQRILVAVAERLGVDFSKVEVCLDSYGNTSSASIPLAVDQARRAGRLQKGDTVLMTGFGAGMTWASAVVTWS